MILGYSITRRVSLFFCVLFYGFIGLAGSIWIHFTGKVKLLELLTPHDNIVILLGIGCGIIILLLNRVAIGILPSARDLEEEFGFILGKQPRGECLIIALVSSISEEIFFRGAMMQNIGLPLTTVIFALVHWPISAKMIIWPLYAFFVGLVFGFQFQWTNCLLAPILTHFLINFLNLMLISKKYGKYGETA